MDSADVVAIRALLGRAYAADPLTAWIFRDPATRVDACAAWYGLFAETYAASGRVTFAPTRDAVCLWRMPDDPPLAWPGLPTVAGLLAALVGAGHAVTVGDGLHPVAELAPGEPAAYVNFLAVDPAAQGRGAGARVLEPAIAAARSAGIGVRLESTNPRNLPFYERLGFRRTGQLAIGDDVVLVALRREP